MEAEVNKREKNRRRAREALRKLDRGEREMGINK